MLIFDVFKCQCTDTVLNMIEENEYVYVYVPPNLTNHFQPLNVNVNGFAKTFVKTEFQECYATQVQKQLDEGKDVYPVSVGTKLSIITPLHARWLISLYDSLRNKKEMIKKAFEMACITEALSEVIIEAEDPSGIYRHVSNMNRNESERMKLDAFLAIINQFIGCHCKSLF